MFPTGIYAAPDHEVVIKRKITVRIIEAMMLATPCVLASQQITVGPTITISADAPSDPHGETFLAVNPKNPANLLASSNVIRKSGAGTSAYVSGDTGRTWARVVLPAEARSVSEGWDVINYFDGSGTAYYASMYYAPYHKVNHGAGLWITRSTDGGHTWSVAALVPGASLFDRPFMGVDRTGKFTGRVYAGGNAASTGLDGRRRNVLAIAFSDDSARTFGQPRLISGLTNEAVYHIANMVVTRDGTLIVPFTTTSPESNTPDIPQWPSTAHDYALRIAVSNDGGDSYTISPRVMTFRQSGDRGHGLPIATMDGSGGPFDGRLYLLYEEDDDNGTAIRVIHSSDEGRTWSAPVTVNDNATPAAQVNPAIAVDERGVVGVTWNDRRRHANECYDLYFSASRDGGETFLKNVTPGGKSTCPTPPSEHLAIPNGGETQGLIGISGTFHAAWADGSSGVLQLATTTFTVHGSVRPPSTR